MRTTHVKNSFQFKTVRPVPICFRNGREKERKKLSIALGPFLAGVCVLIFSEKENFLGLPREAFFLA